MQFCPSPDVAVVAGPAVGGGDAVMEPRLLGGPGRALALIRAHVLGALSNAHRAEVRHD